MDVQAMFERSRAEIRDRDKRGEGERLAGWVERNVRPGEVVLVVYRTLEAMQVLFGEWFPLVERAAEVFVVPDGWRRSEAARHINRMRLRNRDGYSLVLQHSPAPQMSMLTQAASFVFELDELLCLRSVKLRRGRSFELGLGEWFHTKYPANL